jgi:phosphatidylglycerol:prolipoprotein diacylglycerol transferase
MDAFLNPSPYRWTLLGAIIVSLLFWARLARREPQVMLIYLGALGGAFVGAKLLYLAAEGWLYAGSPQRWQIWATGKSVLGALLGGYLGVELAKNALHYKKATGDWFAIIAPCSIALGRLGCLAQGCCPGLRCDPAPWTLRDAQGTTRWPAVPAEIAFNLAAITVALILRRRGKMTGQHFHLFLIGYGLFRFLHEFLRDTPRVAGGLSGYQFGAAAVFSLGVFGFALRRRAAQRAIVCRGAI